MSENNIENNHDVIMQLLEENQRLLKSNHEQLLKINKRARLDFWIKIVIYSIIFIVPLLFIPYLLNGVSALTGMINVSGDTSIRESDAIDLIKQLQDITR